MDTVDLGLIIIFGILGATMAGILLRKIAPLVAQILVFCIMVYVIGGIAQIVLKIGIAKSFLGLIGIGAILFCLWAWSIRRRSR